MKPETPRTGDATSGSATPARDSAVPHPFEPGSSDAVTTGGFSGGGAGQSGPDDRNEGGASRFFGSVKQKATSQLNAQKHRATDELDQIAQAVKDSTTRLRDERHDLVAQVVERAADQLERFAGHLRERDIDDLFAEVEQFGRRQPALFIGSTFAAGLLAARFLKASSQRSAEDRIWYEDGRG